MYMSGTCDSNPPLNFFNLMGSLISLSFLNICDHKLVEKSEMSRYLDQDFLCIHSYGNALMNLISV